MLYKNHLWIISCCQNEVIKHIVYESGLIEGESCKTLFRCLCETWKKSFKSAYILFLKLKLRFSNLSTFECNNVKPKF